MKNGPSNKIKLGIFVTLGVVLLVTGVYFIGSRQQLFSKTFHLSTVFNDINGLQVGNNVRFSGINIGIVESVSIINDTSVQVDISVDNEVQKFIKKNATVYIGSDGLMGNKILGITPGTPDQKPVEDHDFLVSIQPLSMDQVFGKLKQTSDNAALITSDLAVIVGNIRAGKGTVGKLFMDTIFATNLDRTIVNIKQGTKGFQQNMEAAKSSILLRGYFKKKDKEKDAKDSTHH